MTLVERFKAMGYEDKSEEVGKRQETSLAKLYGNGYGVDYTGNPYLNPYGKHYHATTKRVMDMRKLLEETGEADTFEKCKYCGDWFKVNEMFDCGGVRFCGRCVVFLDAADGTNGREWEL